MTARPNTTGRYAVSTQFGTTQQSPVQQSVVNESLSDGQIIDMANAAFGDQPGASRRRKDNDLFYIRTVRAALAQQRGATTAAPQPDGVILRSVAETLARAIYGAAQRLGIANADHSSLSVAQCLHLLECIAPVATATDPQKPGQSLGGAQ